MFRSSFYALTALAAFALLSPVAQADVFTHDANRIHHDRVEQVQANRRLNQDLHEHQSHVREFRHDRRASSWEHRHHRHHHRHHHHHHYYR